MSWLKRRLGLILWSVVWISVLVVPLWRLRATRQWATVSLELLLNGHLGLTSDLEAEAARRFPNDVKAQLAHLNVPLNQISPRTISSQQTSGSTFARQTASYFARYDDLERRFPGSNEVRAQRLRDVTRGYLDEHEGPISPGREPATYKFPRVTWLMRPELESSLRTARAGVCHDPTNGFFPWMEAVLLFTLNRPDEAIQALDRAGKCTTWTDYTANTLINRIELRSRIRPTGWEDATEEASSFLLPHYAALRSAARAATGQMRLARRQGKEERALEIAGILQRAGAVMARGHDLLITRLVGVALCHIAWHATVEKLLPDPPVISPPLPLAQRLDASQKQDEQYLQSFVSYTRTHGRDDLASEALRIAPTLQTRQFSQFVTTFPYDRLTQRRLSLCSAFWLNSWLLRLTFAGSLVWVTTYLFTRRTHKEERRGDAPVLLWAFFCVGATAMLLTFLVAHGEGRSFIENFLGDESPPPPYLFLYLPLSDALPWLLLAFWAGPLAIIGILRFLQGWKPNLRFQTTPIDKRRVALWILWTIPLALLFVLISNDSAENFGIGIVIAILLSLVATSVLHIVWVPPARKWVRIFGVGALWLSGTTVFVAYAASVRTASIFGLLIFALISAILALLMRLLEHPIQWRAPWVTDIVYRLRLTAAVLALAATLGYGGVTLWSIPVEREAQTLLQRQLQIGENDYLREQLYQPRGAPH